MPVDDSSRAQYVGQLDLQVPMDWLPLEGVGAVIGRCIRVETGGVLSVKTLLGQDEVREMAFTDGETRLVAVIEITDFGDCDGVEVGV